MLGKTTLNYLVNLIIVLELYVQPLAHNLVGDARNRMSQLKNFHWTLKGYMTVLMQSVILRPDVKIYLDGFLMGYNIMMIKLDFRLNSLKSLETLMRQYIRWLHSRRQKIGLLWYRHTLTKE
jgi:hypothetical protein